VGRDGESVEDDVGGRMMTDATAGAVCDAVEGIDAPAPVV